MLLCQLSFIPSAAAGSSNSLPGNFLPIPFLDHARGFPRLRRKQSGGGSGTFLRAYPLPSVSSRNDRYQVICGSRKMYFPDPAAELFLQKHAVNREQQKNLGLPPLFTEEAKEGVLSGVSYSLRPLPVRPGKASLWLFVFCGGLPGSESADRLADSVPGAGCGPFRPAFRLRPLPLSDHGNTISFSDSSQNGKQLEIKDLPHPLGNFLSCLVIRFSEKAFLPYSYLQFQLEEIFPHTNMGVFRGDIVLFYSQPVRPAEKAQFFL